MKTQLFRMSALVLAAMMLITACGGATPTAGPTQTPVVMEVTRIVAGTPVVETVIVTATPPPATSMPESAAKEYHRCPARCIKPEYTAKPVTSCLRVRTCH